ncbi:hypothetical protein CJF32_00004852 [Rutstroemia sp. NJR-2017a WRK4]|nr:hypothetical protein CJF32_00004852 [Rutstroemia sp. NJR-2017a WRK4]
MCLRVPKDDPIVFVDRRNSRRVQVESRRRSARPVSRVSETIITHHRRSSYRPSTSSITLPPPSPKPATPVPVVVPISSPVPSPTTPVYIPATPIHIPATPAAVPATPAVIPATPAFVPATPAPIVASPATPQPRTPPQAPTPPESRIELIQVEEEWDGAAAGGRSSPSVSASHMSRRKSRRGSTSSFHRERERGGSREEVYIQRERIIERGTPPPPPSPKRTPPQEGGYRYVEGVGKGRDIDHTRVIGGYGHVREGEVDAMARKRGSVTYVGESPRSSGRFGERERERVVVDEGQRRREFYRRG